VNEVYTAFARHWGFTPLPIQPRRPQENGKQERSGGYVKGNALKGHRFDSLDAHNAHLRHWNRTIARRQTGRSNGLLRPNGTIVPRNSFVGDPIHRVDMRILRRFPLSGRARLDGILEVFNLFDHANYGTYTLAESNASYGQPALSTNGAYKPRMLQLGFRATF